MKISLFFAFNALMLLQVCILVFAQARFSNETDMQALLEFKSQVTENKREVLASWNHSFPLCHWIGITCGRKQERVTSLDLGGFKLSGSISPSIGNLSFLRSLNLGDNSFQSNIPQEFEGSVPTKGVFQNGTTVSVFGNENLCGGVIEMQLKPCIESPRQKKPFSLGEKVAVGVGVALLFLFIIVASLSWFKKKNDKISYEELYNATSGFSSSNLIGSGNFSDVFKGLLGLEEKLVAVKVLNLLKHGATKSFIAECESFKGIRHRNLAKLITVCSSLDSQGNDFRALVYEFMPKGSLDMWLQPEDLESANNHSRSLTFAEKVNIAIDVASALEYLHVYCHDPVAHCDIKPSNVLLDDDLTAHVSDFGLARLLYNFDEKTFLNQFSSAGVRGTIGYAAPEYGMGSKPSIQGDVYSFGVLLLEMFTGKKPTDNSFGGGYNLHGYTKSVLSCSTSRGGRTMVDEWLRLVLEVGIKCSEEYPRDRMGMAEAVRELVSIKSKFFTSSR
ncbi:Leucine-rich repeat protein kinase family protein [Arabidopsis thaliana]|uniref:non-specific serine/threonine protein kinase n=1 Tax=Arabidopsis thaliana TaxID=3702 RepID=F4KEF0_ARATH|nr:Leucine-rich repeat protein kinase family protein [Arabidopsis thaliana]AED94428.1 Leucine-rich repeat protein kinase family protein [Arabidopsis thaliana]|eukprot:NP_198755.1 Leucine-rich repeat protein kinase family protein [Arabidopsis thaliana]